MGEERRKAADARVASNQFGQMLDRFSPPELPTSEQVAGAQRSVTGFQPYQPQTMPGQFANTAAEFVPGAVALGPGGGLRAMLGNAAKFGVVPGVTSEGAGQLARAAAPDLEGPARFVGALVGPFAASAARRVVTPNQSRGGTLDAAVRLEAEGIPTTGGQRTGNMQMQRREAQALGGAPSADFHETQLRQFTRAVARRAGVETDDLMPETVLGIAAQFDDRFRSLAGVSDTQLTQQTMQRVATALRNYNSSTSQVTRIPRVPEIVNEIRRYWQRGGRIAGEEYQDLRSFLGREAQRLAGSNYQAASALREMQRALDDAMGASLTDPRFRAAWAELRSQYSNWVPIQDSLLSTGADTALRGLVSPQVLLNVLKRGNNKRSYVRGIGDLNRLARDGASLIRAPSTSGTAENLFAKIANKGGGALPAASGAAAGLAASGGDPMTAMMSALAAQGAKSGLERAKASFMFSGPGRAYYSNQLLPAAGLPPATMIPPTVYGGLLATRRDR